MGKNSRNDKKNRAKPEKLLKKLIESHRNTQKGVKTAKYRKNGTKSVRSRNKFKFFSYTQIPILCMNI